MNGDAKRLFNLASRRRLGNHEPRSGSYTGGPETTSYVREAALDWVRRALAEEFRDTSSDPIHRGSDGSTRGRETIDEVARMLVAVAEDYDFAGRGVDRLDSRAPGGQAGGERLGAPLRGVRRAAEGARVRASGIMVKPAKRLWLLECLCGRGHVVLTQAFSSAGTLRETELQAGFRAKRGSDAGGRNSRGRVPGVRIALRGVDAQRCFEMGSQEPAKAKPAKAEP